MADESSDAILHGLHEANIEFILVGGTAAVLLGAPVSTEDVDIVHRQTPENLDRLLIWLLNHGPTTDTTWRRCSTAGRSRFA